LDRSPLGEFLAREKEPSGRRTAFTTFYLYAVFKERFFSNPSPNYDTVSERGRGYIGEISNFSLTKV
ncbi:MAG: hypothetical protein Q8N42_01220, partial [bacterium]|nr:hypothetical protein [bacterium]